MKFVETKEVQIDRIKIGPRLRRLDDAWVQVLADQIAQNGQSTPIELLRLGRDVHLTAGRHRLAAVKVLGHKVIRASIFKPEHDDTEAELRLYEADENLFRAVLSALERAEHLGARKEAYERLFPDTKQGVAGGKARQGSATDTLSFAAATAGSIGMSERAIQRAVKIYSGLAPEVRDKLAASDIADNQRQLERLADEPDFRQTLIVDLLVKDGGPRNVATAAAIAEGQTIPDVDPTDRAFGHLMSAWARAPEAARCQFLDELKSQGALVEGKRVLARPRQRKSRST